MSWWPLGPGPAWTRQFGLARAFFSSAWLRVVTSSLRSWSPPGSLHETRRVVPWPGEFWWFRIWNMTKPTKRKNGQSDFHSFTHNLKKIKRTLVDKGFLFWLPCTLQVPFFLSTCIKRITEARRALVRNLHQLVAPWVARSVRRVKLVIIKKCWWNGKRWMAIISKCQHWKWLWRLWWSLNLTVWLTWFTICRILLWHGLVQCTPWCPAC